MTPSLTSALKGIDFEFQPDVVIKMLEDSTTQYAGALLRLASLQAQNKGNSRAYCRAYDAFVDRAEQYQWAQGMIELVMRN